MKHKTEVHIVDVVRILSLVVALQSTAPQQPHRSRVRSRRRAEPKISMQRFHWLRQLRIKRNHVFSKRTPLAVTPQVCWEAARDEYKGKI